MERIPVGVVGVGYLGQHHARIYAEHPGAELVGVVDADPARAAEIATRHGTRVFPSAAHLAREVRAVSIAAPTVVHHSLARLFLEAGVDILVEKPVAVTLAEAEDLVALAEAGGLIFQVGHLERFNGAVRAMMGLVTTPLFIECNRLSPFPERSTDINVVLDLMIHDIDIILSLVGARVESIRASGIPVLSGSVDIANARLEFATGCVANITASRISMKKERKIRLFQPDHYLSLDYQAQELNHYRRVPDPEAPSARPRIEGGRVDVDKQEPLKVELEEFLKAVSQRTRPAVSGREGTEALRIALEVVEEIERSAARLGEGG
jgi:predicted dehydrogenase